MKLIKTKLLQRNKGRKRGKYLITLEVTDYDLEMIEDLVLCDMEMMEKTHKEYHDRLIRWSLKMWTTFWKLWNIYDEKGVSNEND